MKNCIQSRVKVEDLTMFDLEYIFLQIRAVSVGEVVEMNVTCQDDNETTVKYAINLTEVEVQFPEEHSKKIEISDTMGVIMKYPGYEAFIDGSIIGNTPTADDLITIIASCIDQIYDGEEVYDSSTTSKKEFVQFVEGLTNKTFEQIQKFFESTPVLAHSFTVKNPNTGKISEFTIQGLSNFFG